MQKSFHDLMLSEFITYFKSLEDKTSIVNDPNLKDLSVDKFKFLLLNLEISDVKALISNYEIYDKIMNIPSKIEKRTFLHVLKDSKKDILKLILESEYSSKYPSLFLNFFKTLKPDELSEITSYDLNNIMNSIFSGATRNDIYDLLKSKYDFEKFDDIFNLFYSKLKENKLNLFMLLKIDNYKEFILYSKFGVNVKVDEALNEITLSNGTVLPLIEIINCKDKYVTKLIEDLKNKQNSTDEVLLTASIKLYYIFGYDNSKKIIDDKFTHMTDSAYIRVNDFEFKDERREFRAKNQQKFYYYGMVDEIIKSLYNNDLEIFKNLLYNPSTSDIQKLKLQFQDIYNEFITDEEKNIKIKNKISECINIRETRYKNENMIRLHLKEIFNGNITARDIYEIFKNVDINKFIKEYDTKTILKIQELLLGNMKVNNDCLLRLIINKMALGLNESLGYLINDFKVIEEIVKKGKLKMNSVLDLIDVLKVKFYDLRPNEQDIYLSTISRIVNSTEYKTNYDVDVAKEICELHVKRKEKVYSSIPTVSGKTEDFDYEVAHYDSECLLAAGLDGKNCFRIGGYGEEFFRYCLTDANAVVIYLKDIYGNKYICPTIRVGNTIMCNGIDPVVPDDLKLSAIEALENCFRDIIKESYKPNREHFENIEVATLSNLHFEEFFERYKFDKYNLDTFVPLNTDIYSDYNKPKISHYILSKSTTYDDNKYYLSKDKFYQKRDAIYEFNTESEYDLERISLIINSIMYTSIDYSNLSLKEKNKQKRNYKNIDASMFTYFIGNKDWFIAILKDKSVIGNVLPYDERAKAEYYEAYSKLPSILKEGKDR